MPNKHCYWGKNRLKDGIFFVKWTWDILSTREVGSNIEIEDKLLGNLQINSHQIHLLIPLLPSIRVLIDLLFRFLPPSLSSIIENGDFNLVASPALHHAFRSLGFVLHALCDHLP